MKKISPSQPVTQQHLRRELNILEDKFEQRFEEFNDQQEERFRDLKSYMYNLIDAVITQMKEMQVEHTAQTQNIPAMRYEIEDHEDRISKLELVVRDKKR